jgi:hypothetical protein
MFFEIKLGLYEFFKNTFPHLKHFQIDGFQRICSAIIRGQSLKISEISRNADDEKLDYKQKRKKTERFLRNSRIEPSVLQRLYLKFLFSIFFCFKAGKNLSIIVDYSDFNGYRILHGGIPMRGRIFPIYFKILSIKRSGYDLKGVEATFLRNLKQHLPLEYKYTIVADRGFGNNTFMHTCKSLGFYFVLRIKGSVYLTLTTGKRLKASEVTQKYSRNIVYQEHSDIHLVITQEKGQYWYLLTNVNDLRAVKRIYEERFWTEEFFRDLKTWLQARNLKYNMEIMKRLLFLGQICYNFVFEIGLTNKIDTSSYSSSELSFFPKGVFFNQIQIQKIPEIF